MSDPRRRISQHRDALLGPPVSDHQLASEHPFVVPPLTPPGPDVRTIGKKQGRLRCVGLYLSAPDADHLRSRAKAEEIALGVALMQLLNRTFDALDGANERRPSPVRFPVPARRTTRRNLERPSIVYVLLDPAEAAAVKAASDALGLSVSDMAGRCIRVDAASDGHA